MIIKIDYNHPVGEVRKVTLANGEVWKLEGECNRCGECCASITSKEFVNKQGLGCKHLFYENVNDEEVSGCKIYWERPGFCVLYPQNPYEKLFPSCSYKWVKVKTKKMVERSGR